MDTTADSGSASVEAAYDLGFAASGEGWNGEYPGEVHLTDEYKFNRHCALSALASTPDTGNSSSGAGKAGERRDLVARLTHLAEHADENEWTDTADTARDAIRALSPLPDPSDAPANGGGELRGQIARIVDPHSFLGLPLPEDPHLHDMVTQSVADAYRKADRIMALATRAPRRDAEPGGEAIRDKLLDYLGAFRCEQKGFDTDEATAEAILKLFAARTSAPSLAAAPVGGDLRALINAYGDARVDLALSAERGDGDLQECSLLLDRARIALFNALASPTLSEPTDDFGAHILTGTLGFIGDREIGRGHVVLSEERYAWLLARAGEDLRSFARAILHGDDEHRFWLMEAAEAFIAKRLIPAPRGKSASTTPDHTASSGTTKLGAGVLCAHEGRLLLGKAAPPSSVAGLWQPPAGGVEYGERVEDAALRELREEAGVIGEIGPIAGIGQMGCDGRGRHKVVVHYHATARDPALRWNDEFEDMAWFGREAVIAMDARGILTPMTKAVLAQAGWLTQLQGATPNPSEGPYRTGRKIRRNVYQHDEPQFMAESDCAAVWLVALLNAGHAVLRPLPPQPADAVKTEVR